MPTTVHKILIHSPQVIATAILPIGQLSEEAQEARNKDIKRYHEGFSRKCSRKNTLEDVFHMLLVSSDPFISSLRKLPKKKIKKLPEEVVAMLLPPCLTGSETDSEEDQSYESEKSSSD